MRDIRFRLFGKNSKELLRPEDAGLTLTELQSVCDVSAWHVMQFTDLKDTDGNDIYEGDIVKWDDASDGRCWRVGIVEWDKSGQWCFNVKAGVSINCYKDRGHIFQMGSFMYSPDPSKYGNQLLIIGNIFENPELVEVSTNGKD